MALVSRTVIRASILVRVISGFNNRPILTSIVLPVTIASDATPNVRHPYLCTPSVVRSLCVVGGGCDPVARPGDGREPGGQQRGDARLTAQDGRGQGERRLVSLRMQGLVGPLRPGA